MTTAGPRTAEPWTAEPFVPPGSVVRRVWGDADLVLLVFAGAAAEFALNRAADWLFVTGALPRDPLGRLFSTAAAAQRIALGARGEAERTLAGIRAAHAAVERRRGGRIPDWAHRDVLYLLVDYSERAFAALHRPLAAAEREELYREFRRVGVGLGIPALPDDYRAWREDRAAHMARDLAAHLRRADVVIAAAGVPVLITPDQLKPGAAVLDVGITRTEQGLVGDVDPGAWSVAGHLAPMPGGVGPMTRAMLLLNVVEAAEQQAGLG